VITIELTIDGARRVLEIPAGATLLEVLRAAGATSVKNGCATGDCGACAVILDGQVVNACFVFAAHADGSTVTTVAGLAANGELTALQRAFLDTGAVQCGFCTPGMLLVATDLLARNPSPTEAEIREALAGTFCRCTGYVKPVEAIARASGRRPEGWDA
jgi:aerobic-type carbon monoxide dehydrogenase small subunit (CoxS/CutS family)